MLSEAGSLADLAPFAFSRVFTAWSLDPVLTVVTVWAAGLYLFGVWVLHDRGVRWPLGTHPQLRRGGARVDASSRPRRGSGTYDTTLLSVHMVQHMVLSMVVPLFLALGAPVTLMLRTLPRTPRRWLLALLHSRVATVLTFAPLTFLLFVISPWALYFTSWYDATLRSVPLHELMHLHLVVVGALFFWPLVGIDPVPGRVAYPFRLLLVVLTLPFHAFLGVTIMSQETLIGGSWYRALPMRLAARPGGRPARRRRHPLGRPVTSSGWSSSACCSPSGCGPSMREARREDRRLDRLEAQAARQDPPR